MFAGGRVPWATSAGLLPPLELILPVPFHCTLIVPESFTIFAFGIAFNGTFDF